MNSNTNTSIIIRILVQITIPSYTIASIIIHILVQI